MCKTRFQAYNVSNACSSFGTGTAPSTVPYDQIERRHCSKTYRVSEAELKCRRVSFYAKLNSLRALNQTWRLELVDHLRCRQVRAPECSQCNYQYGTNHLAQL